MCAAPFTHTVAQVPANETFVHQGEAAEAFFVITCGTVNISVKAAASPEAAKVGSLFSMGSIIQCHPVASGPLCSLASRWARQPFFTAQNRLYYLLLGAVALRVSLLCFVKGVLSNHGNALHALVFGS